MTQLCHPFQSHDSLSRDHMLHVADSGGSDLVSRIVLGVFIGVLLAIATLLSAEPPQTVERLTLSTEAPPAIVVDGRCQAPPPIPTPLARKGLVAGQSV